MSTLNVTCILRWASCKKQPTCPQCKTPFKFLNIHRSLDGRFEDELIIAVGKGEPAMVMSEYGFKNVLAIDEYASYFEHIDPLEKFKNWVKQQAGKRNDQCSQRVQAVFIVSDSVDWSRDIQGDLIVSNAGDCRTVCSRGGVAEALTSDHRPSRQDEQDRIEVLITYFDRLWTTARDVSLNDQDPIDRLRHVFMKESTEM
ncbi:probable protein phosphatase 2c 25 [Phtheirospermum japonicum]|uniref:Probable protein phosphatase 2c 25 n=1 Tax=Phtheirospermum japonicum TaxID=374723 RepID=A0A830BMK7_9LAMI|nr:probable protein phosphatase 2c 25 [Phtheirospermum japonicum]